MKIDYDRAIEIQRAAMAGAESPKGGWDPENEAEERAFYGRMAAWEPPEGGTVWFPSETT